MREHKYKYWDSKNDKWGRGWMMDAEGAVFRLSDIEGVYGCPKIIPVQWTGLQDSKGVDIYEGDIVRILYTDWPSQAKEKNGRYSMTLAEYKKSISSIGEVVFSVIGQEARFELSNQDWRGRMNPGAHGELEVIGDIYQNPELIK